MWHVACRSLWFILGVVVGGWWLVGYSLVSPRNWLMPFPPFISKLFHNHTYMETRSIFFPLSPRAPCVGVITAGHL